MNELNNFNYVQTNLLVISYLCDKVNDPLYYVGEFERDYKLDENYPTRIKEIFIQHQHITKNYQNIFLICIIQNYTLN